MKVSLGFSQAKDHIQAANEAIVRALVDLGHHPASLAIIFTTPEFAHPLVLKTINNLVGDIPVVGCSTLAIISPDEIIPRGFAVALFSLSEHAFFNTALIKDLSKKGARAAGNEMGEKLLYGCKEVRRSLSLIFSDGLITNTSAIVSGIEEKLGKSFPLIGASASNNPAFNKTYQYFNKEMFSDACCGILWGGKLNFGIGIKHGWFPLGKAHRITKASGNIVQEIDNAPAIKLYEDYLNKEAASLTKELKRISILYPLGIYLEGEKEYLLRNITEIQNDGSLVTQGDVPHNCSIHLMIGTKDTCLEATLKACSEAKQGLAGQNPGLIFAFSSTSRLSLLGKKAADELGVIKASFGAQVPIIGIYTSGEQAPLKSINYLGKSYFHNQSICILAMGGNN